MLKKKKEITETIKQSNKNATNFEISLVDITKRSEKRAWVVAILSTVITIIFALSILYMLPLKEKIPYLVLTDSISGMSTISRLQDNPTYRSVTANEIVSKSNVANYVKARESYDWELTNVRDWSTVLAMSNPEIAATYKQQFSRSNPNNPNAIYGTELSIRTEIRNITLGFEGNSKQPTSALVSYDRYLYERSSNVLRPLDSNQATMTFTYKPNLEIPDQYRYLNPLGFQVSRYRVDKSTNLPKPVIRGSFSSNDLEKTAEIDQEPVLQNVDSALPNLPGINTDLPNMPDINE